MWQETQEIINENDRIKQESAEKNNQIAKLKD